MKYRVGCQRKCNNSMTFPTDHPLTHSLWGIRSSPMCSTYEQLSILSVCTGKYQKLRFWATSFQPLFLALCTSFSHLSVHLSWFRFAFLQPLLFHHFGSVFKAISLPPPPAVMNTANFAKGHLISLSMAATVIAWTQCLFHLPLRESERER